MPETNIARELKRMREWLRALGVGGLVWLLWQVMGAALEDWLVETTADAFVRSRAEEIDTVKRALPVGPGIRVEVVYPASGESILDDEIRRMYWCCPAHGSAVDERATGLVRHRVNYYITGLREAT